MEVCLRFRSDYLRLDVTRPKMKDYQAIFICLAKKLRQLLCSGQAGKLEKGIAGIDLSRSITGMES